MADPDISDYELRNNSTVFEEFEVSIVDFPSIKVLKIYKFSQYLDTIQIKIKGQMVTINAEINWTAVQEKHFINNKQTPELQENIASFSFVQCSSWPFNSQFGCFVVVAMLMWTHIQRSITQK